MARKTVITKVLDVDAQDGIIEFPQNRTLYADQFTENVMGGKKDRVGFSPKCLEDVFEYYQPSKSEIPLDIEGDGTTYEDFSFKSIKDFEDDQLIEQSELLSSEKGKLDAYNAVIHQLEKNKTLRNALKDEAAKNNLKNALKALANEIEDAEKL